MDKVVNDELYEATAKEVGVDIKTVKAIVDSQSKFTKQMIESGALETVTMPYLGKIKPKAKKVEMLMNKLTKQQDT